ncbi:MAG: hypothetical protein ACLGIM_16320, partial [Alphaproteobacteria bacterium]
MSIGDWSKDGHCRCEFFRYEATHDPESQRHALLAAQRQTGLTIASFGDSEVDDPNGIAIEWRSPLLTGYHLAILGNH